MPRLALGLAFWSLALVACGKSEQTGNTSALDRAVSAEDFVTSDVTAIDAATGADANMAADVDVNQYENAASADGNGSARRDPARSRRSAPPGNASDAPTAEPAQPPPEPPAESNAD
jgi:hypothetical protein